MRIAFSVLLLLLLVPTFAGRGRLALYQADARVSIAPVPLDATAPQRRRLGALTYLGGWHLSSWDPAFGGFSSMAVEGNRFLLLSDGANFLHFRLTPRGTLDDVRVGALPDGPGGGWDKADRDSESLARDAATGQLWVGFEQANAIFRFSPDFNAVERQVRPRAMANWLVDFGPEVLIRLRSGAFIAIAERAIQAIERDHASPRPAVYFAGDPTVDSRKGFTFRYRAPRGFSPTDGAELPDGRLILLNRRVDLETGFVVAVTVVEPAAIRAGATVVGREIARFAAPVIQDNFEAIAVTREGKSTIVWIASDDNQQWWERSLLLKFRLDE